MMNRASTHGEHNTTYSSTVRPRCDHKGWALGMMCLWNNWSIQLFVLVGLIFQITLAVLASRRKISSAKTLKFVVWASFSLASYILTLALSKLTTVSLNKSGDEYDTELKALLAPLSLLLLGGPDSITAYSAEDNRVGMRSVMNLAITFSFVVWILGRCWKTHIQMILFFPMFVAGIIKCGQTFWASYTVYNENTNIRIEAFLTVTNFREDIPDLAVFLKAYDRFNCLKPHLVDWPKYSDFMLHPTSIDNYEPGEVFLMTEMELGFMYDVLYTKAPVLYTKPAIALRAVSYFSLLLTFGGFMGIFFDKLLRDPYVIYTFGLLIGIVLLETCQFLKIFHSDWIIIKFPQLLVFKFQKFLVKRSLRKQRWSNRIRQFNFLDFCQPDKQSCLSRILRFSGIAEKLRRHLATNSVLIANHLKPLLVENIQNFEIMRRYRPFRSRGEWTLGIDESRHMLKWSIDMKFDKSIIVWHIATHFCYHSSDENSPYREASKVISEYMMFLLVRYPRILSLTTADITFQHAYTNLETFLKKVSREQRNEENLLKDLLRLASMQNNDSLEIEVIEGWNPLEEAQRLISELESIEDTWVLISSVWIEMLCFAAYNCQQNHHVKLLRQGGDIITHVWLLLSHKTDEFDTIKYMRRNIEFQ